MCSTYLHFVELLFFPFKVTYMILNLPIIAVRLIWCTLRSFWLVASYFCRCWERTDTGSICGTRPATLLQKLGIKLAHAILKQTRIRISWTCCKHLLLLKPVQENAGGLMPLLDHPDGFMVASCHWKGVGNALFGFRNQVSAVCAPELRFPNLSGVLLDHVCPQNMFCQLSSSRAGGQSGKHFKGFATFLLINFTIMRRNMCNKLFPSS